MSLKYDYWTRSHITRYHIQATVQFVHGEIVHWFKIAKLTPSYGCKGTGSILNFKDLRRHTEVSRYQYIVNLLLYNSWHIYIVPGIFYCCSCSGESLRTSVNLGET